MASTAQDRNSPDKRSGLAIVTGASSGIGAEFARQLAARQLDVLLVARRAERLESLAAELKAAHGIEAHVLPLDLAKPAASEKIAKAALDLGKPVKWVINNAGYGLLGTFESQSLQEQRDLTQVLVNAPIELSHLMIPALKRAAPSHIVNIASLAAFMPGTPGSGLYAGHKATVVKFSEMLAAELRPDGVSVTASCPGVTVSEIFDRHEPYHDVSKLKAQKAMPTDVVVRQAIEAADRGQISIVHGLKNKLVGMMFRHLPLSAGRKMVNGLASSVE